jgi:hypothetical protein
MDARFRFSLIGLIGLLIAAVWFFPNWYPLVNRDARVNPFPGLPEEAWEPFLRLANEEQSAYRALRDGDEEAERPPQPEAALALVAARLMSEDTLAPETELAFEPPAGSVILRQGEFITLDVIRGASGKLIIYQLPDQTRVLRLEDFKAVRAPDLRIVFTSNPDPTDVRGVGVDYIDVGALRATVGNQTYSVPASVDFSLYPVLVLYSPRYNLVVSTATLG